MQAGKAFIFKIDAIKKQIETRNTKEFDKLYRRIGKDLINSVATLNIIKFRSIIENYKFDYVYIFRNIFQDAKEAGFGFEMRTQLGFDKRDIIALKAVKPFTISTQDQAAINDRFDIEYIALLNAAMASMVSSDFLESEAKYFEDAYQDAELYYEEYVKKIDKEINKLKHEIIILFTIRLESAIQTRKNKQKTVDALEKQLTRIKENAKTEILKQFKNQIAQKSPLRAQGNAEYGTGQATSKIREAEYNAIKQSNVSESPQANVNEARQKINTARQKITEAQQKIISAQQAILNTTNFTEVQQAIAKAQEIIVQEQVVIAEAQAVIVEAEAVIAAATATADPSTLIINKFDKLWWEKSQFLPGAKPRVNHLAISGTNANAQGNFSLSGYSIPHPRHPNLPASESARCRCEIEYRLKA